MCMWIPGDASPNRMDAMVWAATDLLKLGVGVEAVENPFYA
jgi:phage terminase large subunit-like protein